MILLGGRQPMPKRARRVHQINNVVIRKQPRMQMTEEAVRKRRSLIARAFTQAAESAQNKIAGQKACASVCVRRGAGKLKEKQTKKGVQTGKRWRRQVALHG